MTYVPSEELVLIARLGHYRITKVRGDHKDFTLWCDGRIEAQGGLPMITVLFENIEKEFQDEPAVYDPCCCGRDPDLCICDGTGTA
jgi:hypothetical protein